MTDDVLGWLVLITTLSLLTALLVFGFLNRRR
jgi:hypothetical protein